MNLFEPFKIGVIKAEDMVNSLPIQIIHQIDLMVRRMEEYISRAEIRTTQMVCFEYAFSVWAKWSGTLNSIVREKAKTESNYAFAYAYWWNRLHYLEKIVKGKIMSPKFHAISNKAKALEKNLELDREVLMDVLEEGFDINKLSKAQREFINNILFHNKTKGI
jgi:hypothetical protein